MKKKEPVAPQRSSSGKKGFYRDPVFLFVVKLFIPLAVFYMAYETTFYNMVIFPPYAELHASVAGFLLKILGQPVSVVGRTVGTDQFSIIIVRGCDAIESVLIFTTAVLAFPASFSAKLKGIAVGLPAIHLLNLVRIVSLFFIGVYFPSFFEKMHVLWWQTIFILAVVVGWFIWLQLAVVKPKLRKALENS